MDQRARRHPRVGRADPGGVRRGAAAAAAPHVPRGYHRRARAARGGVDVGLPEGRRVPAADERAARHVRATHACRVNCQFFVNPA